MFKKRDQIQLAPGHHVSGADRKKLGRRASVDFHLETEQLQELFPSKVQLAHARFSPPSRAALYTLNDVPWMIDMRAGGKEDLIPTVLALQKMPMLLPAVTLWKANIGQFILNGADLMLPGVDLDALPQQLQERALVSIALPGQDKPLAVGRMIMSSETMRAAAGTKGRAVEVLHHSNDLLSSLAPDSEIDAAWAQPSSAAPLADEGTGLDNNQPSSPVTPVNGLDAGAKRAQNSAEADSKQSDAAHDRIADTTDGSLTHGTPAIILPEDMDALLEETLLQSLVTTLKDKALPLVGGSVWNAHMLPARRIGVVLNLKASTHKKLPKLLQAYGQTGCQLLTVRDDKATGDVVLTSVNRSHPLLRGHTKWTLDDSAGVPPAPPSAPGSNGGRGSQVLTIEEQFRPRAELAAVFEAAGADPRGTYSARQTEEVAVRYAVTANLAAGASSPSHILLDTLLCDALYRGVLRKGEKYPTEMPKSHLRSAVLSRMLPQLLLTRGSTTAIVKGAANKIAITTEKRRNNKKVTRLVGFEAFLLRAEDLAADLQRHFAASATIAPLPGAVSKGHEIALQGEVVQKMAAYLIAAHGVPSQYITASVPGKKKGADGGQKRR